MVDRCLTPGGQPEYEPCQSEGILHSQCYYTALFAGRFHESIEHCGGNQRVDKEIRIPQNGPAVETSVHHGNGGERCCCPYSKNIYFQQVVVDRRPTAVTHEYVIEDTQEER